MQYAASVPFSGDTDKAFSLAEAALTGIGFRLTKRTAGSLELVGPGMNSTRQSPLVGASRIHIFCHRSELAVEAELGGVARMSRFVTLFPPGLCLFLAIVFAVVFGATFGPGVWLYPVMGTLGLITLVWLLLGPRMAQGMRQRTCQALDTLLANMAAVGEPAERA